MPKKSDSLQRLTADLQSSDQAVAQRARLAILIEAANRGKENGPEVRELRKFLGNSMAKGESKPKTGLMPKQDKAIVALLSNPSIADAAKDAGVNPSTIFRWLQDKEFHAAYMKARRAYTENARKGMGDAVSLKTRVDRLASRANLNACPVCSNAVIQIYDSSDPRACEPAPPRYCLRCGRDLGISRIFVMIPDNHRDVA